MFLVRSGLKRDGKQDLKFFNTINFGFFNPSKFLVISGRNEEITRGNSFRCDIFPQVVS